MRASDLEPLTRHLSSLPRPSRKTVIHPMRSPWWLAPFASCLCLEWLVRRRRRAVGNGSLRKRAIDKYLAYLRDVRRVSPNTVESYARDLSALAAFAEKQGRDAALLDRRDLEGFVRSLRAGRTVAAITPRAVACVRGFYKFTAVDQGKETSPAAELRAPRAGLTPEVPRSRGGRSPARAARHIDTARPPAIRR